MRKEAVDQASKTYWSEYFRDYGKMWVRDIPRRVKAGIKKLSNSMSVEGTVAPLASHVGANGVVSVEAAFIGEIDGKQAKVLVTADLNDKGEFQEFHVNRIA